MFGQFTRERQMSVLVRAARFACMAILVSVTAGPLAARAEHPLQAASATQHLQVAQRDAAYCRSMAAEIQSMRNNYNSQCSGSLPPQQVARCNSMRQQLQDRIDRYNAQCG
jgi:hypothetical protein